MSEFNIKLLVCLAANSCLMPNIKKRQSTGCSPSILLHQTWPAGVKRRQNLEYDN